MAMPHFVAKVAKGHTIRAISGAWVGKQIDGSKERTARLTEWLNVGHGEFSGLAERAYAIEVLYRANAAITRA